MRQTIRQLASEMWIEHGKRDEIALARAYNAGVNDCIDAIKAQYPLLAKQMESKLYHPEEK